MTDKQTALRALLESVGAGDEDGVMLATRALSSSAHSLGQYFPGHDILKAFSGSLDAVKALIEALCYGPHQVTVDWGPSGCGAKLSWWPDGLSGNRTIETQGYDVDPARAVLGAGIRALIAGEDA